MKLRIILLVLALLAFLSASSGGYLYYSSLKKSVLKEGQRQTASRAKSARYRVSAYLSENLKSVRALAGINQLKTGLAGANAASLSRTNKILDHFKDALQADVCYLMDAEGNTVASSNRNSQGSFVGKNYAFRPYYQKAINGSPAVYMAVGVTSKKRGIYYSHPIYASNLARPSGVVVVKNSVAPLERELKNLYNSAEAITLVTDPHGVIFISNKKKWLLHTLWELPDAKSADVLKTRQFGDEPLKWLGLQKNAAGRVVLNSSQEFLIHQAEIISCPGWSVFHLTNLKTISKGISDPLIKTTGYITLILCVLIGLSVFFLYTQASSEISHRKRAEEALRASEINYREIFNAANDAVFVHDSKTGKILDANQKMTDMFGYSSTEVRLLKVQELSSGNPPYTQPDALEKMNKAAGGEPQLFKWLAKKKAGELFWVEINLKRAVIGGKDQLLAVVRDISERVQSELALRDSEFRYRQLVETMNEGLAVTDQNYIFTFVNKSFCRMLGHSRDEMIGHHLSEFQHDEDKQKMKDQMARRKRGEENPFEIDWKPTDGRKLHTLISPRGFYDSDGTFKGSLGVITDITDRKKAKERLRQSEERYRSAMEANPDPVVVYDIEGTVVYFNPAFTRVFGWTLEECRGQKLDTFVPEENWPETRIMIDKVLGGESFSGIETRRYTKDGKIIPVSVSGAIFKDKHGNPSGSVINLRDISEQKELEAQFLQAQKMESIGTLAGGVAHDFNNLLMGIQGRTSIMLQETESYHPNIEHLIGIEEYIKSAADLSKQLLGFARGGKYEVKPTNINDLIDKSSQMFGRAKKEILIQSKYQHDIWTVDVDRGQIEQVLLNLYVNAWQAMSGAGELYLETENVRLNKNFVKPYEVESGRFVKITVTDKGVGIDDKIQQRIFDPFFTTKKRSRGTGLGLASAYGIIRNHNGIINVNSERGQGATFNIFLPVSGKKISAEKQHQEAVLNGNETVLLVDDEEMIIQVGERILKSLGYKVLTAHGGKKAIEILENGHKKINLVVLDMIMPGMDGGEAFDRLKDIQPDIKILLSSGYSLNGQAKDILDRGCDGFIQKPFGLTELSQKIREVLDRP